METIELTNADKIAEKLALHKITMKTVFVPFSRSRNSSKKNPSLNWRVTLCKDGRDILTTDYDAGIAHCPSYKQNDRTWERAKMIAYECENGRAAIYLPSVDWIGRGKREILPKIADFVHSILMDSSVLEHSTFESWASDFGYDVDSRKAEATYRACLEIALKLRNGLGESVLSELHDIFQDY